MTKGSAENAVVLCYITAHAPDSELGGSQGGELGQSWLCPHAEARQQSCEGVCRLQGHMVT